MSETAQEFIKRTDLIEKLEFLQGYIPKSYFDEPPQDFIEGLYEELNDYIEELKSIASTSTQDVQANDGVPVS